MVVRRIKGWTEVGGESFAVGFESCGGTDAINGESSRKERVLVVELAE